MVGLRVSISNIHDPIFVFVRTYLLVATFRKYFTATGKVLRLSLTVKFVCQMFYQMGLESKKRMALFCCNGTHCLGDIPESKVFFQFLPGRPVDNKAIVWLRLGFDEVYVKNPEPPSNDEGHWCVVEELRT
jgi:hypothetical protein